MIGDERWDNRYPIRKPPDLEQLETEMSKWVWAEVEKYRQGCPTGGGMASRQKRIAPRAFRNFIVVSLMSLPNIWRKHMKFRKSVVRVPRFLPAHPLNQSRRTQIYHSVNKQKDHKDWKTQHLSGWWFGCHFLFSQKSWEFHHPNWRSYFQRGGWTTNQL